MDLDENFAMTSKDRRKKKPEVAMSGKKRREDIPKVDVGIPV